MHLQTCVQRRLWCLQRKTSGPGSAIDIIGALQDRELLNQMLSQALAFFMRRLVPSGVAALCVFFLGCSAADSTDFTVEYVLDQVVVGNPMEKDTVTALRGHRKTTGERAYDPLVLAVHEIRDGLPYEALEAQAPVWNQNLAAGIELPYRSLNMSDTVLRWTWRRGAQYVFVAAGQALHSEGGEGPFLIKGTFPQEPHTADKVQIMGNAEPASTLQLDLRLVRAVTKSDRITEEIITDVTIPEAIILMQRLTLGAWVFLGAALVSAMTAAFGLGKKFGKRSLPTSETLAERREVYRRLEVSLTEILRDAEPTMEQVNALRQVMDDASLWFPKKSLRYFEALRRSCNELFATGRMMEWRRGQMPQQEWNQLVNRNHDALNGVLAAQQDLLDKVRPHIAAMARE